jgi:DNA-binding IscR family transcriptional regulator
VECVEADNNECSRKGDCVTITVWKKLNEAINSVVDNITLEELVELQKQKSSEYVI